MVRQALRARFRRARVPGSPVRPRGFRNARGGETRRRRCRWRRARRSKVGQARAARTDGEPYRPDDGGVRKRNGSAEPVDVNKIVRAVGRCCVGLADVDALRVATKTISGLYDGATTRELDQLSIQTAAGLISEEPQYAKLAARLLATYVDKEVRGQEIQSFSQSVGVAQRLGLANERLTAVVTSNARKLNDAIAPDRDRELEYFGLRTLYDRYLLRHPQTRLVVETPQQFFLRIACALSDTVAEALEALPAVLDARVPAELADDVQRGHAPRAALELLPAGFTRRSPHGHLPEVHGRGAALEVFGRHRPRIPSRALARLAHREHQRPLQRHRAVVEDARRVGVGRQPGRQAQGRGLRVPRAVARRRRGVPRAARQHGRRGEPHAQPQPRQLDPRSLHAPRGDGRRLEPVRSQGRADAARSLRPRLRARVRRG